MFSLGRTRNEKVPCEIYINSVYNDVLVIQGSPLETSPVLFSGHILFSLSEPVAVKRVSLSLLGKFKLEFLQVGANKHEHLASAVKEESVILDCLWDNLLVSGSGDIVAQGRNKIRIPSRQVIIPAGNFQLPFSVTLPGNLAETVEGLQAGSVHYVMECVVDRGSRYKPSVTRKYVRVVRTLRSDNLSIQEELTLTKSWPEKLQYEISVPSKAVCIGGETAINIAIFPFRKSYRLQHILVTLIQNYSFKGQDGAVYDDDVTVSQRRISDFSGTTGCDAALGQLLVDAVHLQLQLPIPNDLKSVTQDCDVGEELIRVRHRLKIRVMLGNGDSRTEIKATMPLLLYVSPSTHILCRRVLLDNSGRIHFRSGELDSLFSSLSRVDPAVKISSDEPPPTYEKHSDDAIVSPATYSGDLPTMHRAESLYRCDSAPTYHELVDAPQYEC